MRMFYGFIIVIFFNTATSGCSENNASPVVVPRDTTITPGVAITDLQLDSTALQQFINTENIDDPIATLMQDFYNSRNYQYAWFTSKGLDQQAYAFWNLHNHFIVINKDSSFHDDAFHDLMNTFISNDSAALQPAPIIQKTELQLTEHFLRYANRAYNGTINPEELKWYIPRKKINALALLDSMIRTKGENIDDWEPVNSMYKLVKGQLLKYYELEKNGGLPKVPDPDGALRKGDSASLVKVAKRYLHAVGDLATADTSELFNDALEAAVRQFQSRHGLKEDGIIGKNTTGAMNVSLQSRIEQLLVNLERMRWLPPRPDSLFLLANIPSYRLYVMENGQPVFDMAIVVGKERFGTVIFTDSLKYVVFSPYWNIPRSIVRNEIQPAMNRNPRYLEQQNMEITGHSNGLPIIRQKPGGNNALGRVKFIFPNNYSIYFHDTPAKSLFSREKRAFSHGCIRLEEPARLADYLLQNKPGWTTEKISEAMYSGEEKWVTLDNPVPVFITYFTAWVDQNNLLHFRDDIYGHDKNMADRLFTR